MTIRLFGCLTKVCCGPCPDTYTIEAWEICGGAGSPCASYGLWMPKPSTGPAAGANKATITYANCAGGGSVALPIRTYHVIPAYGCESSPHEGAWLGGAWSSCDTCSMANPLPGTLVHVTSVAFSYDPALAGDTGPEQLLAIYTYSDSGGDAPGTTEAPHPACPAGGALGFGGITNNIAVMGNTPTASNGPWPCSVQFNRHSPCGGGTTLQVSLSPGSKSIIESQVGPITAVTFYRDPAAPVPASLVSAQVGSTCSSTPVWAATINATDQITAVQVQTAAGLRLYHVTSACYGLRAVQSSAGPLATYNGTTEPNTASGTSVSWTSQSSIVKGGGRPASCIRTTSGTGIHTLTAKSITVKSGGMITTVPKYWLEREFSISGSISLSVNANFTLSTGVNDPISANGTISYTITKTRCQDTLVITATGSSDVSFPICHLEGGQGGKSTSSPEIGNTHQLDCSEYKIFVSSAIGLSQNYPYSDGRINSSAIYAISVRIAKA